MILMIIYYNILYGIFTFNYYKIENIEIIKLNFTTNENHNIFIATLENGIICNIDIKNEIMISNFIKNMNEYNVNYYTHPYYKKNICTKPEKNIEIIFYFMIFYYCIILTSLITIIVSINVYFELCNKSNHDNKELYNYNV
jgi:hypothetical protein